MAYILLFLALVFAYIAGCGAGKAVADKTDEWDLAILVLLGLALLCATPVAFQLH